jgi:hypothetical protein
VIGEGVVQCVNGFGLGKQARKEVIRNGNSGNKKRDLFSF